MRHYTQDSAQAYQELRPRYPSRLYRWLDPLAARDQAAIIEVGCGPGNFTVDAVERWGGRSRYLAVDPSAHMLAELANTVPTVVFAQARAEELPFDSATVDILICPSSFHQFSYAEAVGEISRVLRVGGSLVVVWNQVGQQVGSTLPSSRTRITTHLSNEPSLRYAGELHQPFTHALPASNHAFSSTCPSHVSDAKEIAYTCRAFAFERVK